jgi:hypothetical protein
MTAFFAILFALALGAAVTGFSFHHDRHPTSGVKRHAN